MAKKDEVVEVEGYDTPAAERPGFVPADEDKARDERRDDKAAEKRSYA